MYKKSIRKRRKAQPVSWPNIYYQMMVIVSLYSLLWPSWLFMPGVLVDGQRLFNMESMRSRQPFRLPSSFQSVDSYNETITVFNLTTTVSPIEETATKVSVETIDTILEALDGAAAAIDGQHFSTGILGDFTTQRVPGNNKYFWSTISYSYMYTTKYCFVQT